MIIKIKLTIKKPKAGFPKICPKNSAPDIVKNRSTTSPTVPKTKPVIIELTTFEDFSTASNLAISTCCCAYNFRYSIVSPVRSSKASVSFIGIRLAYKNWKAVINSLPDLCSLRSGQYVD